MDLPTESYWLELQDLVSWQHLYDNSMEMFLTEIKHFFLNILCENYLRIYKSHYYNSYKDILLSLTWGLRTKVYVLNFL
jgi:hypothetical protein